MRGEEARQSGGRGGGGGGWRRIPVIARREFLITIRRREFLLITFGLPLLYVLIGVVAGAATVATAGSVRARERATRAVGFMDQSGLLNRAALTREYDEFTGRVFDSEEAGKTAVRDKQVRAFVVIGKEFARNGRVTVYAPASQGSMFSDGPRPNIYAPALRRALMEGKMDEPTVERVLRPIETTRLEFDPATGQFLRPDPFREVGKFVVPYAFSLLLMMSVMFSSSYLLHGIVEEKENRVIEVLLSSVTHEELLAGKLIGLGAVGLVQLGIWVSTGLIGLASLSRVLPLSSLQIGPGIVATAVTMFLLGYALYAALMAGVGSMGTSWRESQQMSGLAVTFLVIPLMVLPMLLEMPDGILSRILSLFPLTAPIGMMLRVAAGGASVGEVILCAVLLAASTYFVIRLSGRLLRLSLLMYGQRPTPAEVWRWLRA